MHEIVPTKDEVQHIYILDHATWSEPEGNPGQPT